MFLDSLNLNVRKQLRKAFASLFIFYIVFFAYSAVFFNLFGHSNKAEETSYPNRSWPYLADVEELTKNFTLLNQKSKTHFYFYNLII
jgi:hypothetical protein